MSMETVNNPPDPQAVKLAFEIEKLRAENRNLRYWLLPPLIQAMPSVVLFCVTGAIAWSSGLLDVKRERNAIESERMRMEQMKVTESLHELERQLIAAQTQVAAFEGEKGAIKLIRALLPASTVEYVGEADGFRITLSPHRAHMPSDYPATQPMQSPHAVAVLSAIKSMHNVQKLEIRGLILEEPELQELGQLVNLKALVLSHNAMTDETVKNFPVMPNVETLYLLGQSFTVIPTIGRFPNLRSIKVFGAPISDEMMTALSGCRETLEFVGLSQSSITDSGLFVLSELPKVNNIYITHANVTVSGIRKLAAMPSLKFLTVDNGVFSGELRADLQKAYPLLAFTTTNDPPHKLTHTFPIGMSEN